MNNEEHLPLSETSFFILLCLAPSPKHGYAIIKEVEALSNERVRLATGTLYTALQRLQRNNLIERIEIDELSLDRRKRKFYRLTHSGRRILLGETQRLRQLLKLAGELDLGDAQ